MADTILSGDITVRYLDDNRSKLIYWSGAATGTRTANEFYSAMATLLDEPTTGDDATAIFADTPLEYTVGLIDANDADPWYVTYDLMEKIQGGAFRTSGWTRTPGTDTGIVVVPVTRSTSTIVAADVGFDITHGTDSDSGTLLEVISDVSDNATLDYLVIRPDSNAAANNFDSTSGTLNCNGNSATQTAASTTGEQIWANTFNVTPIDDDTHVYMYQGTVADGARARVTSVNDTTQDYWGEGAFDRLIPIRDFKTAGNPIIDGGNIEHFARKGNTLYDNFGITASNTSGGRNPVALSAAADGNNTTGYQSITTTAVGTDDFSVGDEIEGDTSGARAIITEITGSSPTYTFIYYLIGDPQITFNTAAEGITNNDATGTATKDTNAPAAQGAALSTWFTSNTAPTVTHANTTFDIDDDGTAEGYGITLNCQNNPLTEVYEWTKYITRNGETSTTNTDGIEGEQYVGATVFLEYSGTVSGGTIGEGDDVTQATSGATGIVISHDTTLKQILLRDTRGTFDTSNAVTSNDNSGSITPNTAATGFNAVKAAPFGSLAGGRFFGARGVLLTNTVGADENNFQLIDSQGNTRTRPIAITLSVSNLTENGNETVATADYVTMHRLVGAGGAIDKEEYSAAGGEAIGAATLVVDGTIAADVPGKSVGAVLNLRDASDNNQHYRIRFSSWATSTFTLANIVATAEAGTNTTQIVDTGAFANARRGDLVLNTTQGNAVSYVTDVPDNDTINIDPPISGQTTGDAIELNAIPVAVNTADDVYVSLIDEYASSAQASVSIVYVSPIDYRVKVANTRATTKIRRFVTDDATSGTDRNVATIRNTDTIIT